MPAEENTYGDGRDADPIHSLEMYPNTNLELLRSVIWDKLFDLALGSDLDELDEASYTKMLGFLGKQEFGLKRRLRFGDQYWELSVVQLNRGTSWVVETLSLPRLGSSERADRIAGGLSA